jgi:hypothetical protein
MLCLKNRTEHRLELSGLFDLVTTGENSGMKFDFNDSVMVKQVSQSLQGLA